MATACQEKINICHQIFTFLNPLMGTCLHLESQVSGFEKVRHFSHTPGSKVYRSESSVCWSSDLEEDSRVPRW
ncbi:hypothetical protein E2C01_051276 [Portunus trituberculatus]|uniref:Uncharacterized protein n=1 Tax=Portunus trituberculatus TaxID=210409 RepID=A0A5B7GAJ7_PORTR|nr:hypothetical protein [Portunus trituberculatus]